MIGKNQLSRQELRSISCGQCHMTYYVPRDKTGKVAGDIRPPWEGSSWGNISIENIVKDLLSDFQREEWTQKTTGFRMPYIRHPEFELFSKNSVHWNAGVGCADCHMPYKSEGGQKFTDHHVQSPLNNVANSCQVCHRESEATLTKNVYDRQLKVIDIRDRAEIEIVRAHVEAKTAWGAGATEKEMAEILQLIRAAQWYWDYAAASHGGSFHSPLELGRVVGKAIDNAKEARVVLARVLAKHGIFGAIPYPDIATKAKAHKFIGFPADKMNKEKQEFLKVLVPEWDRKAAEREATYDKK